MKLRRKLIAAGFAFGATALTLTTSTFAWYTSNTEAKVEEISGMTSATVDASSFYVAAATTYDDQNAYAATEFTDYGSKATPTVTASASTHVLTPVAWRGKVTRTTTGENPTTSVDEDYTKYVPMTGTTYVKGTQQGASATGPDNTVVYGDYSATNVQEYVLRFRLSNLKDEATPLYFSEFNLTTSNQDNYKDQIALAKGADTTGISQNGTYFADLMKALKLTITVQGLKADATDSTGAVATGNATTKVYDLEALSKRADVNIASGKANAVGYYNTVLNKAIAATSDELVPSADTVKIEKLTSAQSTNAVSFASIPTTGYVEVRFTFWLDGWDEYCYDVMLQQAFTFDFVATTDSKKSIIKTATV